MSTLYNPETFGFEIDFLPVGDGKRSGDAICMRWGDLMLDDPARQIVMVVDAGFAKNAENVMKHLATHYKTHRIDYLVSTHPHEDHINGIKKLVDFEQDGARLSIVNLWMHNPQKHIDTSEFEDGRVSKDGVKRSLEKKLPKVSDLIGTARAEGIKMREPFCMGKSDDLGYGVTAYILGPTEKYYQSLLPSFNSTPTKGERNGEGRLNYTGERVSAEMAKLTDDGETSAENDASVVLCLRMPTEELILLTGDAGIEALENAAKVANDIGLNLENQIRVFKVPHHGSIQNLGPDVLDSLIGTPEQSKRRKGAFAMISVSKHSEEGHPDESVTNAMWERNCKPYKTGGGTLLYSMGNSPDRKWHPAEPIPWHPKVAKAE